MKKILLILDGDVAEDFLKNLVIRQNVHNDYLVIAKDESIKSNLPVLDKDRFQLHFFDPTSSFKLLPFLSKSITDAFVVMQDKREGKEVYQIIRRYSARIVITLLGDQHDDVQDKNLNFITETPLVASHFMGKIPNMPLIAKDIGIGGGEIMQVSIPFGSSFAYRTIGSITQKNWKIVAIYRNGKMMLAKYSLVMEPNDSLLIVGDPGMLLEVYRRIREELGQFPLPFGRNLILYCDGKEAPHNVQHSIKEALFLHKKFKDKKLYLRVLNPSTPQMIADFRELEQEGVEVYVEYHKRPLYQLLQEDKKDFNAGLVLLKEAFFAQHKVREQLYALNLPVLRLGYTSLEKVTSCSVLLSDKKESEKIASVAFDIASQLKQSLILYDFAPDLQYHTQTIEHYESISKVFDSKLEVITTAMENPFLWLMSHHEILGIFPFTEDMTNRQFLGPFTTDINRLSLGFIASHKLFLPIQS